MVAVRRHGLDDAAVGEGEVMVLEEVGGGFGREHHHGVDGAELQPHHGAVAWLEVGYSSVRRAAEIERVAHHGPSPRPRGKLVAFRWSGLDYR